MGIGLIDIDTKDCMMLRAHQSLINKELSLRNKTMVDFYISIIKRYRKELLILSTLIVADAYFSTSTFVNGIKKEGFSLISRFRDNACLFYVYAGPRTGKRGRPKTKDGKIDMKNLDLTRMEKMEMKDIEGTVYTLIAYSKALKCKVRLVIWQMPNAKRNYSSLKTPHFLVKRYFFIIEPGSKLNFAFVTPKAILVLWTARLAISGNSILLSMLRSHH